MNNRAAVVAHAIAISVPTKRALERPIHAIVVRLGNRDSEHLQCRVCLNVSQCSSLYTVRLRVYVNAVIYSCGGC